MHIFAESDKCCGYEVRKSCAGADKGIDFYLTVKGEEEPSIIVQCKTRSKKSIGVNYARELLGVMTAEKMSRGILITNRSFTREALSFAKGQPLEMIDVYSFSTVINQFSQEKRVPLIHFLQTTDTSTPTCPNCETKLIVRTAKRGKSVGSSFLGCKHYPRCNYSMPMSV